MPFINAFNTTDKLAGIKLTLETLGIPFTKLFGSTSYADRGTDRPSNRVLTFEQNGVIMFVELVYLIIDDEVDGNHNNGDACDLIVYSEDAVPDIRQYVIEYDGTGNEVSFVQVVRSDGTTVRVAELECGEYDWDMSQYEYHEMPIGTRELVSTLDAVHGSRV